MSITKSKPATHHRRVALHRPAHFLSADDLMQGGDNPYYRVEIPEIVKDGAPGVLYLIPPSARDLFSINTLRAKVNADESLSPADRSQAINRRIGELIAASVVDPETGDPIFTPDNVDLLPIAILNRLGTIVTAPFDAEGKVGNASSEPAE